MRKELKKLGDEKRHTFTGTFERFGMKNGYKFPLKTVLLKDIKLGDELMADHLWFNLTKAFDEAHLKKGDVVQFDARVAEYEKGYAGYREDEWTWEHPIEDDYKLERPTRVSVISRADEAKEGVEDKK